MCQTNSPASKKEQLSMSQLTKPLNQRKIKEKKWKCNSRWRGIRCL